MINMFLSNNLSSGDINSSNLPCLTMEFYKIIIFCPLSVYNIIHLKHGQFLWTPNIAS